MPKTPTWPRETLKSALSNASVTDCRRYTQGIDHFCSYASAGSCQSAVSSPSFRPCFEASSRSDRTGATAG